MTTVMSSPLNGTTLKMQSNLIGGTLNTRPLPPHPLLLTTSHLGFLNSNQARHLNAECLGSNPTPTDSGTPRGLLSHWGYGRPINPREPRHYHPGCCPPPQELGKGARPRGHVHLPFASDTEGFIFGNLYSREPIEGFIRPGNEGMERHNRSDQIDGCQPYAATALLPGGIRG